MNLSCQLRLAVLIGAASIALSATPAFAQDEQEEGSDWLLTLGGGPRIVPEYPGADSYAFAPMPIIGLRREGSPLPFEAPDEGSGFGFLGDDSAFDFGPSIKFVTKRDEDDVGAPVGEVDFTVEGGAFAQLYIGEHFRLRAEGRRGLGGHDGWVGDVLADVVLRDRDTYVFSIGPRARWADNSFHDSYFGVTPAVAATTGLPAYNPGSGIYSYGVYAGLTYMLDRRWGVYGFAGYDRLVGDAADSPIVRAFGSRNQFGAGLGLFYTFSVGG